MADKLKDLTRKELIELCERQERELTLTNRIKEDYLNELSHLKAKFEVLQNIMKL